VVLHTEQTRSDKMYRWPAPPSPSQALLARKLRLNLRRLFCPSATTRYAIQCRLEGWGVMQLLAKRWLLTR